MAGILPTSWAGPNRTLPATFQLSPDQMSRILEMHRESHSNALTYILIVLLIYLLALAIMVARYLRSEDPDALWRLASAVRRSLCTRRTTLSAGADSREDRDEPAGHPGAPAASPTQQHTTVTLVAERGTIRPIPSPSPIALTLREVQDTMV